MKTCMQIFVGFGESMVIIVRMIQTETIDQVRCIVTQIVFNLNY